MRKVFSGSYETERFANTDENNKQENEQKIKVTETAPKSEPRAELKTATDFLMLPELLQELNKLIEKSGIIGEENSRLLLFLITISYLNKSPLHGIVQGSSGSGKTHIITE